MQPIAEWLKKLGMSEYAARFAKNDIEIDNLTELTDHDLERLGVSLDHRRRILRAIRELGGPAQAVPQTAAAPASHDRAGRRQLTVMFCDLAGSTALSVNLDAEDLRGIIASYHRCCAALVEPNGGFVARYMGDGILAYFGYPRAHEHDAECAVRAGLALVEAVQKLETAAGVPLQVRVGIATGLVVVGDLIGTGTAQEQAVVGETPNLAARLQALAEPGAVVIESRTRRMTGGLFEYRDLGTVALKGFAEDVPAWQVLRADATVSRFEALHTITTPLIGRDEEIDLLLRRWDQAKRGEGRVVLISGVPGIGKTHIKQTIMERLDNEPHTRLRYFCSPHHQDSAGYPFITQLERAAGFRRDDSDEQRLAKLEALLAQGTTDLSEVVPLFADWLSIPIGDRYPVLELNPEKRKEKTHQVGLAQVEGLAAHHPLLMVFEDLHWSDPTTREGLDLLVDRIPALRVLVIMTFRPEFTPPWAGRSHVTLLTLNRLPLRQRAEMMTRVTRGKILPKEIADQIMDRTDGIPLFIEELTKAVIESDVLTETDDGYRVEGPIAPLSIPTTLHASLLARLDRLAPTREVAQTAAALGRTFSHELISAVATMSKPQLDDALAQLVVAELIFRRGSPPDVEYTFKHALVQDAAYNTLLRSRRVQLHARIVATFENHFPGTVTPQPALLAQHCAKAGLADKAVVYWRKAGQQAMARSATMEAEESFRQALVMLKTLPESSERDTRELELCSALVYALQRTRGYSAPQTVEAGARLRVLAEKVGNLSQIVRQETRTWGAVLTNGDYARAAAIADHILDLAQRQGHKTEHLALAHYAQVQTRLYRGDLIGAEEQFARLSNLTQTVGLRQAAGIAPITIGVIGLGAWILGRADSAHQHIARAVAFARDSRQPFDLAMALLFEGYLHRFQREPRQAEVAGTQLLSLSEEHG